MGHRVPDRRRRLPGQTLPRLAGVAVAVDEKARFRLRLRLPDAVEVLGVAGDVDEVIALGAVTLARELLQDVKRANVGGRNGRLEVGAPKRGRAAVVLGRRAVVALPVAVDRGGGFGKNRAAGVAFAGAGCFHSCSMKQRTQKVEPPVVAGGQGRSSDDVVASSYAVGVAAVVFAVLAGVLLCLR